jgi:hypothetical protein
LAKVKHYDSNTKAAVWTYLSSNANDTFLWVASVCQELEKTSRWKALDRLHTFPPGLDPLYEHMIQQVYDSDEAEVCKHILSLATIVYRTITLDELTSFVKLPGIASDDLALWKEIVGLCGSFWTIGQGTIYFVRQSVEDFLLQKASAELLPYGMEGAHHAVFSTTLGVMSRTLLCDIYDLGSPGFPIDDVKRPEPDPLPSIRYSCVYWVDHLNDASRSTKLHDDLRDEGAVHQFFRRNCLYWLEAQPSQKHLRGDTCDDKTGGITPGRCDQ